MSKTSKLDTKFSVYLVNLMPQGMREPLEFIETAKVAERLGFESFVVGEHLLFHIPVLDPYICLAAVAPATNRIKLSTSVSLIALRRPLVLAKTVATLDYISRGRVELGIGIGGEYAKEWEANQVPLEERARRTDETIEILKKVWTEDNVTYKGKYFQFEEVTMEPKPPHKIPILVGGRSEAAVKRAARLGDGWIALWLLPDKLRERIAQMENYARDYGRDPNSLEKRLQLYIRIDSSRDKAREVASVFLSKLFNMPYDPFDKYTIYGTADDCTLKLKPYLELGLDQIYFVLIYEADGPVEQVERIYNELLPLISKR